VDLLKKRLLITGAVIAVVLLGAGAVFAASTWGEVNRVSIDRPAVTDAASNPASEPEPGDPGIDVTVPPSGGDALDVFLLVGSDSRDDLEDTEGFGEFEGHRADVVMVLIRPRGDDRSAAILSLPRDLWVASSCADSEHRLNDALEGCGTLMNGPTALTVTVENLIGVSVDHFALVDLAGFQEAVDAIGGYEICLQRAVRDDKAQLHLPAGCTLASGSETLAWLRSRNTQELTVDGWRVVPGISDLTRNERQREFLLSMMGSLGDFRSPQDVASVAQVVAPYVTVDSDLSLLDAVSLAWTMRGLGQGSIQELDLPVTDTTTVNGAAVLVPAVDISEVVASYLAPEVAEDSASGFAG
jgi:LCP family protein required for cell wall assembly